MHTVTYTQLDIHTYILLDTNMKRKKKRKKKAFMCMFSGILIVRKLTKIYNFLFINFKKLNKKALSLCL